MAKTQKKIEARMMIIASGDYGLYYGEITETDEEINLTKMARVGRCRHIAYWEGPMGGITSLAESGPTKNSRIGIATSTPAVILNIRNLFPVSPAAQEKFEAVAVKS